MNNEGVSGESGSDGGWLWLQARTLQSISGVEQWQHTTWSL